MPGQSTSSGSNGQPRKRKITEAFDIEDAFHFLQTWHTNKQLHGNVELAVHIDSLDEFSKDNGLNPEQLLRLINIIERVKLSGNILTRLVKCLIPSGGVETTTALRVASLLNEKKVPWRVKKLLVHWLVNVFDLIDDQEKFHCCYFMVFHLIRSETLSPSVCQLLHLMTKKEDVQLCRVKLLLGMANAVGVAPHVLSLLSIYKIYRPDLVAISLPSRRRVLFKQTPTDRTWQMCIRMVQEKRMRGDSLNLTVNQPVERLAVRAAGWNTSSSLVRSVCTVDMTTKGRSSNCRRKTRVHLEHVKRFNEFVDNLEDVRVPCQLGSVLKNRFVQHVFALNKDPAASQRFVFWLNHILQEEFLHSRHKDRIARQSRLLELLLKLCDFLTESCFVLETFIARYLHTWNGYEHVVQIMEMVSKLSLAPSFEKTRSLFLEPLKKVFVCSPVDTRCKILWSLTELVQNASAVEWSKLKRQWQHVVEKQNPAVTQNKIQSRLFPVEDDELGRIENLADIVRCADKLCSIALRLDASHIMVQHMVLNFYEAVCDMQREHGVQACFVPNRHVFYTLLFANNLPTVSRVAQLLCSYKECFERMRRPENALLQQEFDMRQLCLKDIGRLNSFILDFSDTFWRYKAFNPTDKNSVFFPISCTQLEAIRVAKPNYVLSLHANQAMLSYLHAFLKQTQRRHLHLHPFNVKELREQFVRYLADCEASGLSSFLEEFLPNRAKPSDASIPGDSSAS